MAKLLLDKNGNEFFLKDRDYIQTQFGTLDPKQAENGLIMSKKGNVFTVIEPDLVDYWHKMKRGPQVITLKDIGIILSYTGVQSGWKIVEAGSGSGSLTMFLANAVMPNGKVYSYELRPKFMKIAEENIKTLNFEEYVEFKNKDIYEGIDEKNVDMVALDLAEPWNAIAHAEKALRKGGHLMVYVPTIEQLKKIYEEIEKYSFTKAKTVECIVRTIKVKKQATRPENMGLMHTAYLSFFRRI